MCHHHRYEASEEQGKSGAISLEKNSDAEGFFDDGLTYLFMRKNEDTQEMELSPVRPGHIHFEVYAGVEEVESCDFRFYSVEKKPKEESDEKEEAEGGDTRRRRRL